MYNNQEVQDAFMGLVGMRQNDNPNFARISDDIVKSSSNVLIHHPLINIENLDMCSRNYGDYGYEDWSAVETYAISERVNNGSGIIYASIQNANTNHALTDAAWWVEVPLLSLYLEDIFRNGIDDVMNKFVNAKKLRREAKTLIDNVVLFEGSGNKNDLIVNDGSLVGFGFQLKHSRNLLAMIKRIGHQFTQTGALELWVYHSSQEQQIATVSVTRTKVNSFEWKDNTINFRDIDATYDAGGTFYVMYDQDLAPGQAINKTRKNGWAFKPCSTCSGFDVRQWNMYSKYMTVRAVKVLPANRALPEGSDEGGPDLLWNTELQQYVDTNWGLNFEFMVKCDLTEMLIQHKEIFAFALRDAITVKLLENLRDSTRQNSADAKAGPKAAIALQARIAGGGGLIEEAEKQIKAIDFEFSGFNDYCLPCNNQTGLNYGAAGLQF